MIICKKHAAMAKRAMAAFRSDWTIWVPKFGRKKREAWCRFLGIRF